MSFEGEYNSISLSFDDYLPRYNIYTYCAGGFIHINLIFAPEHILSYFWKNIKSSFRNNAFQT